jgi:hypothetical protein
MPQKKYVVPAHNSLHEERLFFLVLTQLKISSLNTSFIPTRLKHLLRENNSPSEFSLF